MARGRVPISDKMSLSNLIGVVLLVSALVVDAKELVQVENGDVRVKIDLDGDLTLQLTHRTVVKLDAVLAKNISEDVTAGCGSEINCITVGQWKLNITKAFANAITLEWSTNNNTLSMMDCFDLADKSWYGGPEHKHQTWPINKMVFKTYSFVTKELNSAAVNEPYWLNSAGAFIYVGEETPLFVDQNNQVNNSVCFIAKVSRPYSQNRKKITMKYTLGAMDDAKVAHLSVVNNILGKPQGSPPYDMIAYPIWSTWAKYGRNVSHSVVLDFAKQILDNGFKVGQLELDDFWETCYGSTTFDVQPNKFPNITDTVDKIHKMGMNISLWVHPFINENCEPYYTDAKEKGYLVVNEDGGYKTSWWNSRLLSSSHIDFTKPDARRWFFGKLKKIHEEYGIDSFKCDAGETSWAPQIPVLTGDDYLHPQTLSEAFLYTVKLLGNRIEVRTGYRTQTFPCLVRMLDRDSNWGINNGLYTIVTSLMQMNMIGYVIIMPDMIGGNGYNGKYPNKELFIRWLEANVFMPGLQFSYVPWEYDEETVEVSRKMVNLHEKYAIYMMQLIEAAGVTGEPVNTPIWWVAPNDTIAHGIDTQFMLGDVLVAPVIEEGATTRDIYLPEGVWKDENRNETIEGGQWLRNYPAPLGVLPYFTKTDGTRMVKFSS